MKNQNGRNVVVWICGLLQILGLIALFVSVYLQMDSWLWLVALAGGVSGVVHHGFLLNEASFRNFNSVALFASFGVIFTSAWGAIKLFI